MLSVCLSCSCFLVLHDGKQAAETILREIGGPSYMRCSSWIAKLLIHHGVKYSVPPFTAVVAFCEHIRGSV